MQDKEEHKEEKTGFEYLGPQSERNLPPLPRRNLTAHPMPVEGERELQIENYGTVDFHFTWPELERVEKVTPEDDEWAGKDYKHPGGAA